MNPEASIINYLKDVNPSAMRAADPRGIKLRRVLDSLDMAGFIAHLESTFSIRIADSDVMARNFETVGSVIDFVSKKLAR